MTKQGRGRPRELTCDEVLEIFDEIDKPVATAKFISESFGYAKSSVLRRLDELEEDGKLERWSVGANAVVWWKVDN